ncbi:MAG: pimeloyl-[acyl-carrier protein] synthase [Candidatus Azotimanducaceae bacterium]|jgi:pimeloyl-[acyl-carrier protein] synthase
MKLKDKLPLIVGKIYINSMSRVESLIHGTSINILSPKLWADPYHFHSKMRESSPIHYSIALKAYWVTQFDLVQEILKDKRFGADVRKYPERADPISKRMNKNQLESFNNPSMLDLDPPDHSRLRRLVSQGFMSKFIQALEPNIRRIVRDCLDKTGNASHFDLVQSLAAPLPAVVIAEMLGLPESDHGRFQIWSEQLVGGTGTNDTDKIEDSQRASQALRDYFRDVIKIKRQNMDDGMISRLIRAEEEGDKLSETELYNTCLLLLVAGHETTTRLISNGVFLLLESPQQLAQLRADPTLIPQAIEEMLRYEPPVQATRRFATEDIEFHGTTFKKGQLIFLSIAGSNRDPRANKDPDTFDINREKSTQISFGYGIHLCIGAALARLETQVALEELLDRYPDIQLLDDAPAWGSNPFFRGLDHLNIQISRPT